MIFLSSKCYKGNTPVHYACMSTSLPCIVTLLGMGGDLREANFDGENALAVIPERKQLKLGKLLREAGQINICYKVSQCEILFVGILNKARFSLVV